MWPLIVFFWEIFFSGWWIKNPSEPHFPVSSIPEDLKKGSHAVIRYSSDYFEITSLTEAKIHGKRVVTIFDDNADDYGEMVALYNKNIKINTIEGRVYNAAGEQILKLKPSDISDRSAISGSSLYEDDRYKYARLVSPVYPFTVEWDYEMSYKEWINYPVWAPVKSENIGVEIAELKITVPKGVRIRYREFNIPEPVKPVESGSGMEYHWKIMNFKPVQFEPFLPPLHDFLPEVYTGPINFEMQGYKGDFSTWKDFGLWDFRLNENRDSLPPDAVAKIKSLVEGISGTRDQVKKVYEYLQDNTRYVSVQLGIGGYQTYDAGYVANHGYGDCKALSNYMHSLLKCLGIPSYCALVNSGDNEDDILTDFPAQQFNHVILCVPLAQDTVWLECTSQHIPFGYLGGFTCDRHVLLITEGGGVLVKTPSYNREHNLQSSTTLVKIAPDGSAVVNIQSLVSCLQYDPVRKIIYSDQDTQKKWLYDQIGIPDFTITGFGFSENKDLNPSATESIDVSLRHFATVSGKRLFFEPNLMNQVLNTSAVKDTRAFDMEFRFPYTDMDSIVFSYPGQYHPEFEAKPVEYQSDFGTYSATLSYGDGRVIYTRKLEWNKGKYSRDRYPDYRNFIQKIMNSDKMKLVLVKTT